MTLLALGINHKTAPVALRERVTFTPDTLEQALNSLLAQPQVQGGVVLSTCNRTELYLSVEQHENLQDQLIAWLCDYHHLRPDEVLQSLYWHHDNEAVSHLMRVASGLDSLVLGEPQILGQVKKPLPILSVGIRWTASWSACFRSRFPWLSGCVAKRRLVPVRSRWLLPPVPGTSDLRIAGGGQCITGWCRGNHRTCSPPSAPT